MKNIVRAESARGFAPYAFGHGIGRIFAEFFLSSYLFLLFWNYLGIGLSFALLALAESPTARY